MSAGKLHLSLCFALIKTRGVQMAKPKNRNTRLRGALLGLAPSFGVSRRLSGLLSALNSCRTP